MEEEKRSPIHITEADVKRAYKKVEKFQRLLFLMKQLG